MADRVCETFGRTYSESPLKLNGQKVFNVWLDEAPNTLWDVTQVSGIPLPGDSWDDSVLTYLVVVKRTPKEISKETLFFQVVIDYETDETQLPWQIQLRTVRQAYAPTATLAKWSEHPDTWDFSRYLNPSGSGGITGGSGLDSLDGYPIVNRAGDFFEDSPTIDRHLQQITLTKVVSTISDIGNSLLTSYEQLAVYLGAMNANPIAIAGVSGPAWHFLCDDISVDRVYSASGEFVYRVTIVILYDPVDGWATPVANVGYRSLKGATGARVTQQGRNYDGTASNKPIMLDENGTAINIRESGIDGDSGPPYYCVFPLHISLLFEALDLPTTLE